MGFLKWPGLSSRTEPAFQIRHGIIAAAPNDVWLDLIVLHNRNGGWARWFDLLDLLDFALDGLGLLLELLGSLL